MPKAILALEDGRLFEGTSFGADREVTAEVVFNTAMSGYQEVITDPSYRGQIVAFTAPHIGNVGVNDDDEESTAPQVSAVVVRELSGMRSNFRATDDLSPYLERAGIPGLAGIDTRALTRHIRREGAMRGIISTTDLDGESLVAKARSAPPMAGRDLVQEVTCADVVPWSEGFATGFAPEATGRPGEGLRIVAVDYGIKHNIFRHLVETGFEVTRVPATLPAGEILARKPDGVFLSNGPGDPAAVTYAIDTVRELVGKVPIFGICLGHQILCLALGAKTFKLKFGHRGANHPVQDATSMRVAITSQNHGFAVDAESLPPELEPTHRNLNDGTLEGVRHRTLPIFSVQYHPEASPGPHDAASHFDEFAHMIRRSAER